MRVGIIGTGAMGGIHTRVASALPEVESVMVMDTDLERARRVADQYSVDATDSLSKLFDATDSVVVAVPSHLHEEIGVQALEAGKHTLVEKPIATTMEAAEQLIKTARLVGRTLMVGHVEIFNPATIAMLSAVDNLRHASFRRLSPTAAPDRLTTDVVLDLMVHDIAIMEALHPKVPITEIHALGRADTIAPPDPVVAMLQYEDGVTVDLRASRDHQGRKDRSCMVNSGGKVIIADLVEPKVSVQTNIESSYADSDGVFRQTVNEEEVFVNKSGEPLANELRYFLHCARTGEDPGLRYVAGTNALSVLETCLRIKSKLS